MSESELVESAALYYELAIAAMMFYLSVVTGYLVTAHLVGAKLETSQILLVNSLFIFFSLFSVWGSVAYFFIASHFYHETATAKLFLSKQWVPAYGVIGVFEILGIAGSLYFMRTVRKGNSNNGSSIT